MSGFFEQGLEFEKNGDYDGKKRDFFGTGVNEVSV